MGIRDAFNRLRDSTQAGDEVVIYWNGHGTRLASTVKMHSPDGQRGYLMPYDTKLVDSGLHDAKTMISDLEFGNWINSMNNRKIFIFLDTCYAGTFIESPTVHSTSQTGKTSAVKNTEESEFEFNFLEKMLSRSKSIYKDDAIVICASLRSEVSWAVPDEYALATHFFCETVRQSSGILTVDSAFVDMSRKVLAEIRLLKQDNPQVTLQTPVLQGNARRFVLRTQN